MQEQVFKYLDARIRRKDKERRWSNSDARFFAGWLRQPFPDLDDFERIAFVRQWRASRIHKPHVPRPSPLEWRSPLNKPKQS